MIERKDILSLEFLKLSEYTGSYRGMRYRLEKDNTPDGEKLKVCVWPEPFNYATTGEENKEKAYFEFSEEGIVKAVDWMNECYVQEGPKWGNSRSF